MSEIEQAAERYRRQCNDELAHGIYCNGLNAHVQKFRDQETLANAYVSPSHHDPKFPNYDAMLVYCITAMHDTRDTLNAYHMTGLQSDCDRVEAAAARRDGPASN